MGVDFEAGAAARGLWCGFVMLVAIFVQGLRFDSERNSVFQSVKTLGVGAQNRHLRYQGSFPSACVQEALNMNIGLGYLKQNLVLDTGMDHSVRCWLYADILAFPNQNVPCVAYGKTLLRVTGYELCFAKPPGDPLLGFES